MSEKLVRQCVFLGRCLYFFAGYTVLIKYLLPILWAWRKQVALHSYIYFWDAWWVAHILVGAGLARRKKGIWFWAFALSVSEIIIIGTKFVLYWRSPDLDFWHVNWFVNKSFLLVYFWALLIWLCRKDVRQLL